MARLLYLVHRFPYPPNKGDKLRSFHLLKHLSKKHQVFLGTFIDDPEDKVYLPELSKHCAEINALDLSQSMAKLRSLNGLLSGESLTVRYFRDSRMQNWVDKILKEQQIDAVVVFCSGMAQYVINKQRLPILIDLVDVDSIKWKIYSNTKNWLIKWIYSREAETLLTYERKIATKSIRTFLVTEEERALFASLAPETSLRLETMTNGVDTDYFNPELYYSNPFHKDELPIVFTGTMDYWINIEGAIWFIKNVLPVLILKHPNLKFYIVGRNPTPALKEMICDHIIVTGAIDDVRPYIQHARVVVTPIRTSRGLQNKLLEAMAMARPIVADVSCAGAINILASNEIMVANTSDEYLNCIEQCITDTEFSRQMGKRARNRVLADFNWYSNLNRIDTYLDEVESAYDK